MPLRHQAEEEKSALPEKPRGAPCRRSIIERGRLLRAQTRAGHQRRTPGRMAGKIRQGEYHGLTFPAMHRVPITCARRPGRAMGTPAAPPANAKPPACQANGSVLVKSHYRSVASRACPTCPTYAALAQLVRAPGCGPGGPWFETRRRYHRPINGLDGAMAVAERTPRPSNSTANPCCASRQQCR